MPKWRLANVIFLFVVIEAGRRHLTCFFLLDSRELKMNVESRLAVAVAMTVALHSAWAADVDVGRQKAQLCAACHGPMGLAAMPHTPNLAGQPERYLAEQLKAYRSGKRGHEQMSLLAKPLSDADIANPSAWYASLQLQIKT